ncbi:MAG: hypothetical protein PHD00_01025 [Bacteroidales bacterium]|nr:hypothetical protein [Bacteroidales bacterium]MDD4672554.1 hypothetical protein [Bacteroidales bacterium]MDY0348132.1 hypothetical protein [Tenuifilaceae bacterium]
MKKTLKFIAYPLALLLLLMGILHVIWLVQPKHTLNLYIQDKSVTALDRPEHKSLVWILNHKRITKPNEKMYSNTKDYFGFHPIDIEDNTFNLRNIRINEIDSFAKYYDVAYLTDCYGVHSFEWYKGKTQPIRSQKVYGGLNQNDYLFIKSMLEKGKLVIGEYNMLNAPTNALVRTKTESLLNITWHGWTGKYFSTLNTNRSNGPAEWIKNLYESQHFNEWPANKGGIIILSNDGQIELLAKDEHLNTCLPTIETEHNIASQLGVNSKVPFDHWFEFISAGSNSIVANLNIDVNEKGLAKLKKLGLTPFTPAVIKGSEGNNFYYFCGDFADNPASLWTAKLWGGQWLNKMIYYKKNYARMKFFNDFYAPLIEGILFEQAISHNYSSE